MEEDPSIKYTVIRLWNPVHQDKLAKYLEEHKHLKKSSFCRFYLRGLCIMKNECCKFAHDFDELRLWETEYKQLSLIECAITEKEQRKRMFIDKTDFHQRPLFFVKNLDYVWLHSYQFSPRYKLSGHLPVSQEEINRNEPLRHRIREIMHREQWDKVLTFLEATFPEANFTIDMLSCWFARLGFQKAQTFCRFGDFMRYLVFVRGYTQVNIVVPPMMSRSIYYLKCKETYMYAMKEELVADSEAHRLRVRTVKEERLKKMPADLEKRFICRFYMAGNCEKTREECFYVHNISDMRYERGQEFLTAYRQPPKSKEDKMNYLSLYMYYCQHKTPEDPELTLDDLNSKHGYKDRIRRQVHLELYRDFLAKVSEEYDLQVIPVSLVKEEYHKVGFNHTDENKFGQLEGAYWDLGYYPLDTLSPLKEKVHCISKVPPLPFIEQQITQTLRIILKSELEDDLNDKAQILESSVRRLIYSHNENEQGSVPLHVYLRVKKASFKEVLEQLIPEYCPFIFFESAQSSFKKLMEMVKRWLKKRRRAVEHLEDIDDFVRGLSKDEINLNSLINYRGLLQLGLLEAGREVYFFPLANASLVIDRNHIQPHSHHFPPSTPLDKSFRQKFSDLMKERLVVVDSEYSLQFCRGVLTSCFRFGVDLEGKLSLNGYIDLVQLSCMNQGKKFIFVIDVFRLKKEPALYEKAVLLLKEILGDPSRLKVMHSCQQDAVALWSCMGIELQSLFDTSGSHIYLQQRQIYHENIKNSQQHIIKTIHRTKTPGLNQILETWGAPLGQNQLKERMKKVFGEAGRDYFQKRPIEEEFLEYSARDVEDLIEVHEKMSQQDPEGIWREIGKLYASYRG